jgi:hypothetical protein
MDITSRDRFIIGKALLYAIKYVDNLPEHVREHSRRNDMVHLLKMLSPKTVERAKDSEAAYRNSVLEKANRSISKSQSSTRSRTT